MTKITDVLVKPVQTEKTQSQGGKYTFVVHNEASKIEVKAAIKKFYGVDVVKVNMINLPEKTKTINRGKLATRRKASRKAVVTTEGSQVIDFNAIK